MWQVQKRGLDENLNASNSSSMGRGDRTSVNYETFTTLLESFEAKKKCVHLHHFFTAVTVIFVLDIICLPQRRSSQSLTKEFKIALPRMANVCDDTRSVRSDGVT